MIPVNTFVHDLAFFLTTAACGIGQLLDCRTTQVGLANGLDEKNFIGAFLIKHLTITGAYAIKVGAVPIAAAVLLGTAGWQYGTAFAAVFAALGFTAGIQNYLLLKKSKITASIF